MEPLPVPAPDAAVVDDDEDDFDRFLADQLERPAFRGAYEDSQLREGLVRCLLAARRAEQMTQQAVAERMGTSQSAVSDLEGGDVDARLSTLQRYARAVRCRLAAWVIPDQAAPTDYLEAFIRVSAPCLEARAMHWSTAELVGDSQPAVRIVAVTPSVSPGNLMYLAACAFPGQPAWVGSEPTLVVSEPPGETDVLRHQLSRISA